MSEYDDEVQLFVNDILLSKDDSVWCCAQAKPARHAAHNLDSQPFVSANLGWQCSAGNTHSVVSQLNQLFPDRLLTVHCCCCLVSQIDCECR